MKLQWLTPSYCCGGCRLQALFCAISAGYAAVEVPLPILHFLTVYTIHSRQDIVCTAVEKERFIIVVLVTSPVATGHCSWNNPFALPLPGWSFLLLLCLLCTEYKASPWSLLHMTLRTWSQSFWYAACPPVMQGRADDHKYSNGDWWPEER